MTDQKFPIIMNVASADGSNLAKVAFNRDGSTAWQSYQPLGTDGTPTRSAIVPQSDLLEKLYAEAFPNGTTEDEFREAIIDSLQSGHSSDSALAAVDDAVDGMEQEVEFLRLLLTAIATNTEGELLPQELVRLHWALRDAATAVNDILTGADIPLGVTR